MAAHPRAPITMTLAQYLAFERASDTKHELIRGELLAMSGGSRAHSLIQANMVRLLGNALLDRPCEVHTSDMRLEIHAADGVHQAYPDAMVVCGTPELTDDDHAVTNPVVIVEVLSPSSEDYDRSKKFVLYREIPSFREYLLVSQGEPRVEQYTRNDDGTWTLRTLGAGDEIALGAIGVRIAVGELYRRTAV